MGVTLKFEMKDEYLSVQITGTFSLEGTLDGFMDTLEKAAECNAAKVLVDSLALQGAPTISDMFAFGKFVSEVLNQSARSGTPPPRIALVANGSILEQSHFSGMVAKNRDVKNVRAFDNNAEALKWLQQVSQNALGLAQVGE